MIPLYGFLQGDTMGLLILADEEDSVGELAQKLASAARVRVEPGAALRVFCNGRELESDTTVATGKIEALDRIDVLRKEAE